MPKPVLAGPHDTPTLNTYQWYVLVTSTQFFAPRLQPHQLEHERQRHAPWLADLRQYLQEHPVDPREVNTRDQIRQWATTRGIPLAEAGSAWPGIGPTHG